MAKGYRMMTKHGHDFGEAASALQKSIRRGLEEEAMYWALDFSLANYHAYLWKRLVTIAIEDIGAANLPLVQFVIALSAHVRALIKEPDIKKRHPREKYSPHHVGLVVLLMARSPKSREADDFTNHMLKRRRLEDPWEVPDWALDKHTQRGRAMDRGGKHFWEEGAKLENETIISQYVGWDDEHGDGYQDAEGNTVHEPDVKIKAEESPQRSLI